MLEMNDFNKYEDFTKSQARQAAQPAALWIIVQCCSKNFSTPRL